MTVLVVDDELSITETLCEVLQEAGYDAISAANGMEGLRVFERKSPDLVVSDIMMPQLDGREMVRAIRATPAGREVPVIFITAARGLSLRMGDRELFLEKPFDLDEFISQVGRLIRARRNGHDGSPTP